MNEDLILEILFRLPPVSVIRFKCVSKNWYSLITNTEFLLRHSIRFFHYVHENQRYDLLMPCLLYVPRNQLEFVLIPQHNQTPLPSLNLLDPTCGALTPRLIEGFSHFGSFLTFRLIDSCNGLLLFTSHIFIDINSLEYDRYICTYHICNPITKQCVQLPKLEVANSAHQQPHYNPQLVFDPCTSPSYKVVTCLYMHDHANIGYFVLYLYSSDTGSWRPSTRFHELNYSGVKTVFINGLLIWNKPTPDNTFLYFDTVNEIMGELQCPLMPLGYIYRESIYFGECGGRLRMVGKYYCEDASHESRYNQFPYIFDILEFDLKNKPLPTSSDTWKENDCWIMRYHINLVPEIAELKLKGPHSYTYDQIWHSYITQNKKGKEEVLLMNIRGKVFSLNLTSNTFVEEMISLNKDTSSLFLYSGTLHPLIAR